MMRNDKLLVVVLFAIVLVFGIVSVVQMRQIGHLQEQIDNAGMQQVVTNSKHINEVLQKVKTNAENINQLAEHTVRIKEEINKIADLLRKLY